MFDLEFTGERIVPGKVDPELAIEHESRYRLAADYVAGREVADLGCGTGYGAATLRRAGARWVAGIDCAPAAIRYARAHYGGPGLEFFVGDSLSVPFAAQRFDVVVSFEVIEHVSDHRRFLHEVRRTLRPAGVFLLSTPNKLTYRDGPDVAANPFHVHEFHLDELRRTLAEFFPAVAILGQSHTEGTYFFGERSAGAGPGQGLVNLVGADGSADERRLDAADYFLALCALDPTVLAAHRTAESFHVAEDNGVRTRNRRIVELQDELESRTRWAQQLQAEAGRAVDRANDLEARLADAERKVAELAREGEQRGRRILALERQAEERARASARRAEREAGLSAKLDEVIATTAAGLAELRAETARLAEREREHDALTRWHRDTLVLQQANLQRQGAELAARRDEQSRLAGELDRISAALDERVQRLAERVDRQDATIAGQVEQMRRVERLTERARELIDMLWGSRSWRLYTGLTRLLAAARPRRRAPAPEPGAGGAEAGNGERTG